eukprot:SAG11_NODE_2267_length_3601_cov_2.234723_3_plen_97_part_00
MWPPGSSPERRVADPRRRSRRRHTVLLLAMVVRCGAPFMATRELRAAIMTTNSSSSMASFCGVAVDATQAVSRPTPIGTDALDAEKAHLVAVERRE